MTTEAKLTDTTRAAFEVWANGSRYTYDRSASKPDNYRVAYTQIAWTAWQAVLQSPEIRALRKDAERYRWLKENIMEQYNLPGSYYLPDDAPEVWDRTIDAAMEQQI